MMEELDVLLKKKKIKIRKAFGLDEINPGSMKHKNI